MRFCMGIGVRRSTTPRVWRVAFFFVALGLPLAGFAYEETDGIRFGSFSLHPSVYAALRYNDNIYFVADDYEALTATSVPQGREADFVFNVQPAATLRFKRPTFRAEAGYKFYNDNYLGYDDPEERHYRLNAGNHTYTGLVDYQAPVGLFASADITRIQQETYEDTEEYIDQIQGDQTHDEGRGRLGYRHGSQDNLIVTGKYRMSQDTYKLTGDYNRETWDAGGEVRLKFLPRTALLAEGGYGKIQYPKLPEFDSTNTYAMGGMGGQVTTVLHLLLLGGFQESKYEDFDSFKGPIGRVEIAGRWDEHETSVSLGGQRKIIDSSTTNYYISDRVDFKFHHLWFQRLSADLFAGYQYNEFSGPFDHHEDLIQVKAELTLRMIHWLFVGGGYQYDNKVFRDNEIENTTTRNIIFGKVRAQF